MSRAAIVRTLFAAAAIAFFTAPIAARVVGVSAERFENRRLADAPRIDQGWGAFQQASRFLVDRMPLRAQAVRANTTIWNEVFGADPRYAGAATLAQDGALPFAGTIRAEDDGEASRSDLQGTANASTGRKGWLYITEEFKYACDDTVSDAVVLDRWAKLVRAIRATGREAVMFVVPHKASVYPEHLPEKYPYEQCALAAKRRLWRLLERAGPARGVLGLRDELLRAKAYAGDELFELRDMHWTTLGALTLVEEALDVVGDGVRLDRAEIVDRGLVPYEGDLDVVSGREEESMHREYAIDRRPDAPRVPGRTLLICDSFVYRWMRLYKPYFEDVAHVSLYHSDEEITAAIGRADRVIVEANEIFLKTHSWDAGKALSLARALRDSAAPQR